MINQNGRIPQPAAREVASPVASPVTPHPLTEVVPLTPDEWRDAILSTVDPKG